jgi:hypothetical protein
MKLYLGESQKGRKVVEGLITKARRLGEEVVIKVGPGGGQVVDSRD